MAGDFAQNWPVYIMVGGLIVFVIYAVINGRQQEKKDKENKGTKEETSEKNKL